MKKKLIFLQEKENKIFLMFLFGVIILASLVIGLAVVVNAPGGSNAAEDVVTIYNITINNSNLNTNNLSNYTEVNFTLPQEFSVNLSANLTTATGQFRNETSSTRNILSWNNTAGLVSNDTRQNFLFNASVATPGRYTINITVVNSSSTTTTNINITINDTTVPGNITYQGASENDGVNVSRTFAIVNITTFDNGQIRNATIFLYNSSNSVINSTNSSLSASNGTSILLFANFSGLSDGLHYFNVTTIDTYNNTNRSARRTVRIDTTAPSVTLTKKSSTSTSLTITIDGSDASGIDGSCSSDRSSASVSGSGATQTLTESSLSCAIDYIYKVTCTDYAGNSASKTETFKTDACSSSATGGTGGATTSVSWKATFIALQSEVISSGHSRALAPLERVSVLVSKAGGGNETHYVGVLNVTANKAKIQVTSSPQEAELGVGESKKFEVTGDNYYDLLVKLNSISGSKANVTIQSIYEIVPAGAQTTGSATQEETGAAPSGGESAESKKKRNIWLWIIVVAVIAVIVIVTALMKKRKQ